MVMTNAMVISRERALGIALARLRAIDAELRQRLRATYAEADGVRMLTDVDVFWPFPHAVLRESRGGIRDWCAGAMDASIWYMLHELRHLRQASRSLNALVPGDFLRAIQRLENLRMRLFARDYWVFTWRDEWVLDDDIVEA